MMHKTNARIKLFQILRRNGWISQTPVSTEIRIYRNARKFIAKKHFYIESYAGFAEQRSETEPVSWLCDCCHFVLFQK